MSQLAPIILFAYNRPELTLQTLESLSKNAEAAESHLFVFSDGAKETATAAQVANIQKVRDLVLSQKWCKKVTLHCNEKNKGLANSVIDGVTKIVNEFGKVIVVEDDVLLSPYFLKFMNDALDKYEHDERVCGVGSWNYFTSVETVDTNFFLRHPDSISWATYQRAWAKFNPDTDYLLTEIKKKGLSRYLNMNNSIDLIKMLNQQKAGKVDSWAVRWTASMVLENMLTLYPQHSMARHEGYAQGTHFTGHEEAYDADLLLCNHPLSMDDILVEESQLAVKAYIKNHQKHHGLWAKSKTTIKRLLNLSS